MFFSDNSYLIIGLGLAPVCLSNKEIVLSWVYAQWKLLYGDCSSFLSVAVIENSDQKALREGKDLFGLYFKVTFHHCGKLGQNSKRSLKQKPWRKAACQLPCRLKLSYVALTTFTWNDATYSGLGLPTSTSINNQDNLLKTCLQTNLIKTVIQLRLFLQVTLDCAKLTVNAN